MPLIGEANCTDFEQGSAECGRYCGEALLYGGSIPPPALIFESAKNKEVQPVESNFQYGSSL
jgi:hypothetical protein